MTAVLPLFQTFLYLSEITSMTPWEACATTLIEKNHPSSVYFFCKSSSSCPSNSLYRKVYIPMQTIHDIRTDNLPNFKKSDLVFLLAHEEPVTWSNETIHRYRFGRKNNFKLVIVANGTESQSVLNEMENLFQAMWKSGLVYAAVLLYNETSVTMFTYIPFRYSERCEDTTPVKLGGCTTKRAFDPEHKVRNLNNCTMNMSMIIDKPYTAYPLDGIFKPMLLEIGRRLDFSLQPFVSGDKRPMNLCGPNELVGMGGEVATGRAHFAVGPFLQETCNQLKHVGISHMQCFSWCTPILPGGVRVLDFLVGEFQTQVWIGLVVTIFVLSLSVMLLSFLSQEAVPTGDVVNMMLVLFAQVPRLRFKSHRIRTIVAIWLFACVVYRTAYEGEAKSRSTTPIGAYVIRDYEDLADTELQLFTTIGSKAMMKDSGEPIIEQIHNKTIVCGAAQLFKKLDQAVRKKNTAVFTADTRCRLMSKSFGRRVTSALYPYTGGCMATRQVTPLLMLRGSPFLEGFEEILQRFVEAGLIQKWLKIDSIKTGQGVIHPYSLGHLLPALILLSVGWLVGCIIFAIELALNRQSCSKLSGPRRRAADKMCALTM